MFVPRQVQHHTAGHPSALPRSKASRTTPPARASALQQQAATAQSSTTTPKSDIDPVNAKDIVLSLEQLLGSFNSHTPWLEERRRTVDGCNDYIHLAALMECPFFHDTKPVLSQITLRRALAAAPSERLQVSADGYHIRYTGNRSQLFDERTVYIEPSSVGLTTHPGKVARLLAATLPSEFLPVRYVNAGGRAWGFVTLSADVTEEHTDPETGIWPENWIVMTKAEWLRRDNHYRAHREAVQKARQAAQLEERMSRMEIDSTKHRTPSPSPPQPHDYDPGLIVHLTNLHSGINKPTISSFIDRSVDRYLRRLSKSKSKSAESLNSNPPEKKKTMVYIDYAKGATEAWVRQTTREDSELIVKALEKRRRRMTDNEDRKGVKVKKEEGEVYVKGVVLQGEEEGRYWKKVREAMGRKGKKGKGDANGGNMSSSRKEEEKRAKRPRQSSGMGGEDLVIKKGRFEEYGR
ncbi:hypothetical protein EX30DRAFT_396266 [Ascodesmis nigricans]|uniref:XRRM domain-containing protein n=1 Tax=Ascodesmis nigricans TaxID=341454 RepID=A0A4S2MVB6_9PEZI|nr:hypothetical protein EX30DRAFT_396266 [Ascodesmis nigricans]